MMQQRPAENEDRPEMNEQQIQRAQLNQNMLNNAGNRNNNRNNNNEGDNFFGGQGVRIG